MASENSHDFGDDLIKASDFNSIELSFTVKNTVTNTEVKDTAHIKMVELRERGMLLELPPRSCAKGHNLIIELTVKNSSKDFTFIFTAKVDKTTVVENNFQQVDLTLVQFEEDQWADIQGLYLDRQEQILEFLAAAKG